MTAAQLIEQVIREGVKMRSSSSPRMSSGLTLKQKEGYRKAARTRERRQYSEQLNESHGYLLHHYFKHASNP